MSTPKVIIKNMNLEVSLQFIAIFSVLLCVLTQIQTVDIQIVGKIDCMSLGLIAVAVIFCKIYLLR